MSAPTLDGLANQYSNWIASQTAFADLGGVMEITTTFLDRNNDKMQLFVLPTQGGYLLTDDGYIYSNLHASGFDLTESRQQQLHNLARRFGASVSPDGHVTIEAVAADFGSQMHKLLQMMLAVDRLVEVCLL